MGFVHLNVHSHYSRGWGMATVEDLCRSARDLGMEEVHQVDNCGIKVLGAGPPREYGIGGGRWRSRLTAASTLRIVHMHKKGAREP